MGELFMFLIPFFTCVVMEILGDVQVLACRCSSLDGFFFANDSMRVIQLESSKSTVPIKIHRANKL